jgi:G3E family GTPase
VYRIAVDIVTGFLGSGKTTLLRRLAASGFGRNVALLVNELGDVDVDGRVLGLGGIERAVELPGGCICCEIDERRLEAALAELIAARAPDLVVIETSGAAEPAALVARVRSAGLTLDAVTTVIDAGLAARTLREHAVARAQLAAADFVVVNKCDLVAPRAVDEVVALVAAANPRALVHRAERCAVDLSLLFATGVRRFRESAQASTNALADDPALHRHDAISARVFRSSAALSRDALVHALERLPSAVQRAKGIVRVADGAWALLFNYVCGRSELEWLPMRIDESQAVFIGRDLGSAWPAIERAMRACVASPVASVPADRV